MLSKGAPIVGKVGGGVVEKAAELGLTPCRIAMIWASVNLDFLIALFLKDAEVSLFRLSTQRGSLRIPGRWGLSQIESVP